MAAITATAMTGSGARVVTETTASASDTFTYQAGDVLVIRNASGGALTPLIDGAGGTTYPVPGLGNVDVSGGLTLASIANGATVAIPLDSIRAYLQGVITMTGADDAVISILRF